MNIGGHKGVGYVTIPTRISKFDAGTDPCFLLNRFVTVYTS